MANLSQEKRQRMLAFLETIREEHKDDDEVLIALGEIESELNAKKYGLVWERHEEAVDVQMRDNIPVFTECADKEITTTTGGVNFLLEGDNLHSLRLLEKTHAGRIDYIYIDPPYNTGSSDFRYDDSIVIKEDGYRHSKWISFINERLLIAKCLLSEDGLIFISIDDHEVAPLTLLCNEIFGEDNHVETVIWKNKYGAGAKTVGFISVHEYILCYSNRNISAGYQFGDEIIGHALYGEYVRTDMVAESTTYYTTRKLVNTHKHGIELLHSVDAIKSTIGMQSAKVKTILERLFRRGGSSYKKLLLLDTSEFYAFIINNEHRLKEEFREVTAGINTQMTLPLNPKKSIFHIPEQDFYKYDPGVKNEVEYLTNAYHDYTSGYATSLVRSTSEMLFEQFCESRDDIEWVYKNGDTGQQYFSIVYRDGLQNQWLFYADYIIMKKDGTVWIIETKGGETKGKDKNIDIQIENKFNAFKNYAAEHSLHWGFVRDKDNQLYINNTEFAHDMSDDHWVPLSQEF